MGQPASTGSFDASSELKNYRGVRFRLVDDGTLDSVGSCVGTYERLATWEASGAVALTTIGTDVTTPTAAAIQFDTATTAGAVIIGVRKPASGTNLNAHLTPEVEAADGGRAPVTAKRRLRCRHCVGAVPAASDANDLIASGSAPPPRLVFCTTK